MKTQNLLRSILGVAIIAALLPIMSCDTANPPELVGRWVHESGNARNKPEDMELFKNGTGVCDGASISWKVENKRLVILSSIAGLASDYEISGSELILNDGSEKNTYITHQAAGGMTSKERKAMKAMKAAAAVYMMRTAGTWSKMQQVYFMETEKFGDAIEIGYTPPGSTKPSNNGADEYFTYKIEVQSKMAIFSIKNKEELSGCPIGSEWKVIGKLIGNEDSFEAIPPENAECVKLTPNFKKMF